MTDKERIEELERQLKETKDLHEIERFYLVNQARQFQEAQNQKAVEALEKVKELINEKSVWSSPFGQQKIHASTVEQIVDEVISELGGKDE